MDRRTREGLVRDFAVAVDGHMYATTMIETADAILAKAESGDRSVTLRRALVQAFQIAEGWAGHAPDPDGVRDKACARIASRLMPMLDGDDDRLADAA